MGIQDPRGSQAIAKLDLPDGWAIGTSGDYQRYFINDGIRYCHLIHPFTGFPIQNVYSVTVLIEPAKNAGTLSDVLSKPLFIGKKEDREALAKKLNIHHYIIICEAFCVAVLYLGIIHFCRCFFYFSLINKRHDFEKMLTLS